MPKLEASARETEDLKATPSTHSFQTIHADPEEEHHGEQVAALWLIWLMIAIIVACGVMLWIRVNA